MDDFAFRKGCQYGTILVDLERHQPIALLPDRKAETLTTWLRDHPGVEVLSRDRSKTYRSAMNEGAPGAIQVADRFHLVQNLSEALETTLSQYRAELKAAERAQQSATAEPSDTVHVVAKPIAMEQAQQRIHSAHDHRIQQQQAIKFRHQQGWLQATIAQAVGVSMRTVLRYLTLPDFPPTPPRRVTFGCSILAPYKQQILAWWNSGIVQPDGLMFKLKQLGYQGSKRTLTRYISGLREAQGLPPVRVARTAKPLPQVIDTQSPPLTTRRAAYLMVLKAENREPEDTELLEQLRQQQPDLATAMELADEFLQLLRQQQVEAFDDWLMQALGSSLQPFQSFARRLFDDYAAVKASLSTTVSNGPVEGLNNRLKMLKRQMYGRG